MPKMVFQAECAACAQPRKFMEFKAEPCGPMSEGEKRYGFRCLSCKTIVPELVDLGGSKHVWADGQHLEA